MSTPLVERTIIMQLPTAVPLDENALHNDPLLKAACNLVAGNAMIFEMKQSWAPQLDGTAIINPIVWITFYITTANDAVILANFSAFQASWPGWTINTFSRNVVFG